MKVPIIPLVVATALFMENTDATILATALPTIARDLGLDSISLKLAVTSYLVSLAIFIPASAWVADRLGSCITFRLALVVFMAASIGFVFWRAVQGLGGARQIGAATGMASVGQQVSISLGVATGAIMLEMSEMLRGHETPMTSDFSAAFIVVGLISMASALLMRLPGGAGDEIAGRVLPVSMPSVAPVAPSDR